jgi:hypothetical protein
MEEVMTTVSEDLRRAWNETAPDVVAPRARTVAPRLEKPTRVLGGTGKTGRRVAQRLWDRGLPIRIGSRSGEPPFDWENEATWAPALRGVESVYVTYQPDLAVPGAVELDGRNASLADGEQRALGREPQDFADYARETASSGVWDVSALVGAR